MKSIQAHAPEEILKPRVITQGIEASLRFEIDQPIHPIALGLLGVFKGSVAVAQTPIGRGGKEVLGLTFTGHGAGVTT